jgi:hypothetical protein
LDLSTENEKGPQGVKEGRYILHTVQRKGGGTGLGQVMEGKVERTGRRGRKCKQLHYDLKDKRGFCKLNEEAVDRIVWINGFGRGCGPVVMNETSLGVRLD